MEYMIETSNLTKYYGSLIAVDHVSLKIEEGEVFGFLGPNGAGKTTIIKMLVGLSSPSEGTASVAGYDIRKNIVEVKRRARANWADIGEVKYIPAMTASEYLKLRKELLK